MLNLIYRNRDKDFGALFMDNVHAYDAKKLNFNTREEYIDWVKQWKEDMDFVVYKHTKNKRTWKRDACVRADKISKYQACVDNMPELTTVQTTRYNELMNKFLVDYDLKHWFASSYYLVWYMLIIRKAAKIKAAKQRDQQLQTIVV